MALGHQAVSCSVTDWCPPNPVILTPASWVTKLPTCWSFSQTLPGPTPANHGRSVGYHSRSVGCAVSHALEMVGCSIAHQDLRCVTPSSRAYLTYGGLSSSHR